MRIVIALLNIVVFVLGARYVIRKDKQERADVSTMKDPRLRRSQRVSDISMVGVTCGILLMLGWMVTNGDGSRWPTVFFVSGISLIAASFVLAGVSGWIKGGAGVSSAKSDPAMSGKLRTEKEAGE